MFQDLQNSVTIECTFVPDGPILVRAQTPGIDPAPADMEFQRTRRNGRSTVFLSGSGLKGVLRSHAERLLRSGGRHACDPTKMRREDEGTPLASCGKRRLGQPQLPDFPHANQCAACFTFGSLQLAGRFRAVDAYPVDELWEETNRTEVRTGVGIDRKSQGASQGVLYDSEVVVGGGFGVRITGENFSLWQLGLLLAVLDDLDRGLVHIGGAKARGMGSVRVTDRRVELALLGAKPGELAGTRARQNRYDYGLPSHDVVPVPAGGAPTRRGLFSVFRYEGNDVQALVSALQPPLESYLQAGT